MAKGIKDCERYKYSRSGKNKFVAAYPQFAVILDSVFVVFFNIVREVVDGDVIVVDVLHDLQKGVSVNLSPATQSIPFS